uniref:Putative cytochrome P450 n=1 Tax=Puccinia horiana TaxID=331382 RepID=W8FLJ9_9BASI|nr:putative cytochrome P450 [Puccinia horiana]
MAIFLKKMDKLASGPNQPLQAASHLSDSKTDEWKVIDILPWFNYLAFDIIGDLAFGERFGMIERGADIAGVEIEGKVSYLPAIQILNERGEFSATQGSLPAGLRPYMKYIDPWFSRGAASVKNLTGHPKVYKKLMEELEEHLGTEEGVISFADCKDLKYLNACINETLRIHSTSSIGLPRIMPETISFKGHVLPKGLVCSVPTFDVHHDPDVWGDPDDGVILSPQEDWFGSLCAQMITSTIFKRYEFALLDPNLDELETREGFLRKVGTDPQLPVYFLKALA